MRYLLILLFPWAPKGASLALTSKPGVKTATGAGSPMTVTGPDSRLADRVKAGAAISGAWIETGSLNTARWANTATLLQNGTVLVAGGVEKR